LPDSTKIAIDLIHFQTLVKKTIPNKLEINLIHRQKLE